MGLEGEKSINFAGNILEAYNGNINTTNNSINNNNGRWLSSVYYVLGTALNGLHGPTQVILTVTLWWGYYHDPNFTGHLQSLSSSPPCLLHMESIWSVGQGQLKENENKCQVTTRELEPYGASPWVSKSSAPSQKECGSWGGDVLGAKAQQSWWESLLRRHCFSETPVILALPHIPSWYDSCAKSWTRWSHCHLKMTHN